VVFWPWRIHNRLGARILIYLLQDGDELIVLLGGGTKRQQQRDINRAKELLQEYRRRR
jgi:putative addiction module killer protein